MIEEIKKELRENLSEYRYNHSLRVAELSKELALIYNINQSKAYLAGLVHDVAKEFTKEESIEIMKRNNQVFNQNDSNRLTHAMVGAIYLKEKYNLGNDIIKAVSSHTIGDIPMTTLDKIVFVADKIEVGKNYLGIEEERILAKRDLDECLILCIENNHKKLKSEGKEIVPYSIEVLKYLKGNRQSVK